MNNFLTRNLVPIFKSSSFFGSTLDIVGVARRPHFDFICSFRNRKKNNGKMNDHNLFVCRSSVENHCKDPKCSQKINTWLSRLDAETVLKTFWRFRGHLKT